MARRTVIVPGIGEVLLSRRRGARHLRLSITPSGQVRVSVPAWTPFAAGIAFATSRKGWILDQVAEHRQEPIANNARIGKLHKVAFIPVPGNQTVTIRVRNNLIEVRGNEPFDGVKMQQRLLRACEKALRAETVQLLPRRLDALAKAHGFGYGGLRIRKLVSRWGSCSKDGTITLSYYLVQLPWNLIDYVLLHELVHTEHLHHGQDFWASLSKIVPQAKALQKQIHGYKPRVQPA